MDDDDDDDWVTNVKEQDTIGDVSPDDVDDDDDVNCPVSFKLIQHRLPKEINNRSWSVQSHFSCMVQTQVPCGMIINEFMVFL